MSQYISQQVHIIDQLIIFGLYIKGKKNPVVNIYFFLKQAKQRDCCCEKSEYAI